LEKALGRKALVQRKPDQPGDVPRTWADLAKARRLLGYSPAVRIEDGLPLFADWLQRRTSEANAAGDKDSAQ
jgi:UDP-glucuronate 4-epimerase